MSRDAVMALVADTKAHVTNRDEHGIRQLNDYLFTQLGFKSTADLTQVEDLLLSLVVKRKQGHCVGLSALYLVLTEELGLPVRAVANPTHVFLRFDDGRRRVNIETLQGGTSIPDEEYARHISSRALEAGVFLQPLSTDAFLAHVHNNLGVLYSRRHQLELAASQYGLALALHPRFPAAHYNLGTDLLARNSLAAARKELTAALRLNPGDPAALNNRGLANCRDGKSRKARRDFKEALKIDPSFSLAHRNLERMSCEHSSDAASD